ncbi:CopG family transcriptional regulator [Nostoc sp. DSM 114161]|jgi:hypothetical protein|uniref:hypothetical protein n=1 Tax=Nostoc sp. DSM 114161 TaxID=3440143 RepID=UPI0040468068
MRSQFYISVEEKEKIFCTELIRYGVPYEKARKAAQILASGQPDELLTPEEILIVKDACKIWSKQHKRYQRLQSIMQELENCKFDIKDNKNKD